MPTIIRCRRGGRTHSPYYRLVVVDSRSRNRGSEKDMLGIYHPCARPEPISQVNALKALEWLKRGAQMSDTTKSIFSKLGILKHFHDGTMPEEAIAIHKGAPVVDKGYNAPSPRKEKKAAEAPAEDAPQASE